VSATNKIEECRVRAGNAAHEFVGLMLDEAKSLELSPNSMRHFFGTVRGQLNEILRDEQPAPTAGAMDDDEAKWFGGTVMPFGKDQGLHMRSVELSYLDCLNEDEWRKNLARYLASDYVGRQRRQTD